MLNSEDTKKYLIQVKNGNQEAKEILFVNNFGLVKSICKKFINKGVEYEDLCQIGGIGLLKAITNFDYNYNVKLSTYAVPMIIGEIKRYLRDNGSIKVSRVVKMQSIKINRFIEEYKIIYGQEPKIEDIATRFSISKEDVVFALDSCKMPISLYDSSDNGTEKNQELLEKIPSNFSEEEMLDKIMFESLIEKLPERERKLIIMRYYRDKTQSETAKILGISQVQVSRLENKILQKFKSVI